VLSRGFTVALRLLAWVVVGSLLIVVLFRLVAWDDVQIFAMADALGMIVYLPAWVVGIAAGLTRRWLLLAASVAVVVAQLAFGLPELTAATPVPAAARHAFNFRLFDANVYQGNPSMAGYAAQMRAYRPDLTTLEEASPDDRGQLQRAGVLRSMPYVFEIPRHDSRALVIASRYLLGPVHLSSIDGLVFLARTSIQLPVGTVLLVGDFNATWGNRWFRSILATGLTDAAAARGEPFDVTWSQMSFLVPPLIRIDHVLTTPGVVVTTIHSGPGPGSDHRDLTATVAVLSTAHPRPDR